MEGLFGLLLLVVLGAFVITPIVLFTRISSLAQRLERAEAEIARLRYLASRGSAVSPEEPWSAGVSPAAIAPTPGPVVAPPAPVAAGPPPADLPSGTTPPATRTFPPPAAPEPRVAPLPRAAPAPLDASRLEQLVGGVWLQNLGAVLLLLGVFLMIVWGYSTGRLGPQVLVAGGVLFGLALAWRGDRVARRTPRFGHALIGTGTGVVYLTLYLGFVRLHLMNAPTALALLVLVSFGAIVAGLRYRVQAIAAFGVIGAFLPQFMARWLALPGFEIGPAMLLGYLAAIDLVVFALAARAGWSALDLMAIVLSALTWFAVFSRPAWGWGVQVALAALFSVLGLAPLPRLVRTEGTLRSVDLAVVAGAPLAFLLASAPFLSYAGHVPVAMLLLALAALFTGAAWWVDLRRPERDLWVPLTAAATLFATAGIERLAGPVYTWLAWTLEGALLVVLGLRPRGGWLRAMGSLVLALGAGLLLVRFAGDTVVSGGARVPFLEAESLRRLAGVAILLATGALTARRRDVLAPFERLLPEVWTLAGHALLAFWIGIEAHRFAADRYRPGGRFTVPPPAFANLIAARVDALGWSLAAAAWLAQSLALGWRGPKAPVLSRLAGAALGAFALAAFALVGDHAWWKDQPPIVNAASLAHLAGVALMVAVALRTFPRGGPGDHENVVLARAWAAAASLALMLWSVREMRHLAVATSASQVVTGEWGRRPLVAGERALAAALASAAWLAQAVVSLAIGWLRDSAFLRWCGLVLLGLTLLKFLAFDLATVDVFWRFLTAIVVGAAMLAFSYAYQRRAKGAKAAD